MHGDICERNVCIKVEEGGMSLQVALVDFGAFRSVITDNLAMEGFKAEELVRSAVILISHNDIHKNESTLRVQQFLI